MITNMKILEHLSAMFYISGKTSRTISGIIIYLYDICEVTIRNVLTDSIPRDIPILGVNDSHNVIIAFKV